MTKTITKSTTPKLQPIHEVEEESLHEYPLLVDTDTGVRGRDYPTIHEALMAAKAKQLAKNAARAQALGSIDVRAIRLGLKLTQTAFARTFGLGLDAVQQWESGRRKPEVSAQILLAVISDNHEAVMRALDHAPRLPQLAADAVPAKRGRPRKEKVPA